MAYRKDWAQPQTGGQGFARTVKTIGRAINMTVADNVTSNTVGAFTVPAGFVVTGIYAVSSDLDTGTSLTLSVGDSGSAARYLSASTVGQSTTAVVTLASTGVFYKNTTETEIIVTVAAQTATFAAGTLTIYLTGFIDN